MPASASSSSYEKRAEEPTVDVPLAESAHRLLEIMAEAWSSPPVKVKTTPQAMLDNIVRSYYQDHFMRW